MHITYNKHLHQTHGGKLAAKTSKSKQSVKYNTQKNYQISQVYQKQQNTKQSQSQYKSAYAIKK